MYFNNCTHLSFKLFVLFITIDYKLLLRIKFGNSKKKDNAMRFYFFIYINDIIGSISM